MKYEKPELALLADALSAVQATTAKESPMHDTDIPSETTVSAYEADE